MATTELVDPDRAIGATIDIATRFANEHLGDAAGPWLAVLAQLLTLGLHAAVREALTVRMAADSVEFIDET